MIPRIYHGTDEELDQVHKHTSRWGGPDTQHIIEALYLRNRAACGVPGARERFEDFCAWRRSVINAVYCPSGVPKPAVVNDHLSVVYDAQRQRQNWVGLNYVNTIVKGYDYGGCNFRGLDFSGAHMTDCKFVGADLQGSNLSGAIFTGCSFEFAKFSGASANSTVFDGCSFKNTDFGDINWVEPDFRNCSYIEDNIIMDSFRSPKFDNCC